MTVIFEPAAAIAASRCLTARTVDPSHATTNAHPRPCGWCDTPVEGLRSMVEGFNAWAGFDLRGNTYQRHEVRVFVDLPRDEQERQIVEAQAFPEPPAAPMEQPVAPPADADAMPDWLAGGSR